MRSLVLSLIVTLALSGLLVSCSKEESPPVTAQKPLAIQTAEKAATTASMSTGQKVYESSCSVCHTSGAMSAPKLGDKSAWSGHMHHGLEHMVENAIKGVGRMPPKGGNAGLSDEEVKLAVEYIIEQSK